MKLVLLTALTSGQRCQTLSLMNLDSAQIGPNNVKFIIEMPTKSSKASKPQTEVDLIAFPHDPLLCVMSTLKVYLQRTKQCRGQEKRLFLSYVPPHKAVGSETIGRWIKFTLSVAGIDTNKFTAHSTRSASCSAASRKGVPLETIMKATGWSSSSTFARFYNKPLVDNCTDFARYVLSSLPAHDSDNKVPM